MASDHSTLLQVLQGTGGTGLRAAVGLGQLPGVTGHCERLSATDLVFLELEDANVSMHIGALCLFAGARAAGVRARDSCTPRKGFSGRRTSFFSPVKIQAVDGTRLDG